MTSYYAGGGGGCFGARSIVQVRTHSGIKRKQIQDLERGDRVRVDALESRAKAPVFARVLCVAKMLQSIGSAPLVQLSDGLTITPGHPVLHNGRWVAASEHSAAVSHIPRVKTLPSILYNVVLDHTHVLNVDGVACVTWGHQLRQDGAYHPFYGSQRVVLALMALPGFHRERHCSCAWVCQRRTNTPYHWFLLTSLEIPGSDQMTCVAILSYFCIFRIQRTNRICIYPFVVSISLSSIIAEL